MRTFGLSVFLSAFLLFLVQPMIGKYILPWFGATPGVWAVCLLFFQVLLLCGYAFAHLLMSRFSARGQVVAYLGLIGLALFTLPITPAESMKPVAGAAPTAQILEVLLVSVGAPFFLLASTGPLLMAWFARTSPGRSPYRLYALSNAGSLLGLLLYPFVVERFLALGAQTVGWTVGWLCFAVLVGLPACRRWRAGAGAAAGRETVSAPAVEVSRPGAGSILLWTVLAACGSGLLMATTNRLCLDVAVFPLLWIAPLALYLVTFIICFEHDRWYLRPLYFPLLPFAVLAALVSLREGVDLAVFAQVGLGLFTLFITCMCCHGELARRRPHPRHLTLFYLAIAFGGAVGGLFVAVVAPLVFRGFHEFHLLIGFGYLLVCAVGAGAFLDADPFARIRPIFRLGRGIAWGGFVMTVVVLTALFLDADRWPAGLRAGETGGALHRLLWWSRAAVVAILLFLLYGMGRGRFFGRCGWDGAGFRRFIVLGAIAVSVVPVCGALWFEVVLEERRTGVVAQGRNFYGVLRIEEYGRDHPDHDLTLVHGRIDHGYQLQQGGERAWPTAYYGPVSGVGLAIREHPARARAGRSFRVGVVGLGTGTLAAYANATVREDDLFGDYVTPARRTPGDLVTFYEINPLVTRWALDRFTYIEDAVLRGAEVRILAGDARIEMERQLRKEQPGRYDVLAVDAFSSDSIPVHLLTLECFKVYERHLAEDGVLAIHITNRFIRLAPVVRRVAEEMGIPAIYIENDEDEDLFVSGSDWVLLSRCREFMENPEVEMARTPWPSSGPLWTDDFSSIVPLLVR